MGAAVKMARLNIEIIETPASAHCFHTMLLFLINPAETTVSFPDTDGGNISIVSVTSRGNAPMTSVRSRVGLLLPPLLSPKPIVNRLWEGLYGLAQLLFTPSCDIELWVSLL